MEGGRSKALKNKLIDFTILMEDDFDVDLGNLEGGGDDDFDDDASDDGDDSGSESDASESDSDGESEGESDGDGESAVEVEGEGEGEESALEGIECEDDDDIDGAVPQEDDVSFMKSVTEQLRHKDRKNALSAYLTKYEKARAIGTRAAQLENGAPALVPTTGMISIVEIAEAELAAGKLPLIISRPDLNGKMHQFPVGQLIDVIPKI